MSIENVLASVAVRDLARAIGWYAQLLGRDPDSRPMPEVAEWKFPRGGWLQVYRGPERAGNGSFTLSVTDLDQITAHVASLGVDTRDRSDGEQVRTLMIKDPDGNSIAFAQPIDPTLAR